MNLKDVLKKVVEGKELSAEEKAFLEGYDPDSADGRIPKSRLDQEIAKHKAEKERADNLESNLAELKTKIEELENSGKSEAEKAKLANEKELKKLQSQVESLTKERDTANAAIAKSERTAKVSKLAAKHNFSDAEYLDFLASAKELDLDDESATAGFMSELGKSRPELFKSSAKPGGGTKSGETGSSGAQQRIDELLKKSELSSRESNEVIRLQEEINAAGAKNQDSNKGE